MKKHLFSLVIGIIVLQSANSFSQSLSPKVTPAAGAVFNGGAYALSWTLGESFYKTLQSGNTTITQGFQQPYILLKIFNLKVFLQGFYTGNGMMQPVLYSNALSNDETACDSITVELHDATNYDNVIASATDILHTDGNATFRFPWAIGNNAYYIVIRHRNSIETWSKNPVLFSGTVVSLDLTAP
jgi:hypothetical protein